MGYEKFLESQQIRFLVIKDWYQQQPLLDFWTDEIEKFYETMWEKNLSR